MGRKKAAQHADIRPWLSARQDCVEGRFIQVGNSILLSKAFQELSAGAQMLYLCMTMESGGRRDLVFPQKSAKKYGIAARSFRRYVDELVAHGFVDMKSLANLRQPNEYSFALTWKTEKPP